MKKRILAVVLFLCLSIGTLSGLGIQAHAEEVEDTTTQITEPETEKNQEQNDPEQNDPEQSQLGEESEVVPVEIQCMDEEGNIYYITDDVSPVVNSSIQYRTARAANDYIVNLRVRKNGTVVTDVTNYIEYGTNDVGYLYGAMGSDAAYLGTENGQIKFMISGVIGLVNPADVQLVSKNSIAKTSHYVTDGSNIIHRICTNMNTGATSSLKVGPQQSYMSTGATYYSYDGHYFYTDYSVMLSDYRNNTRKQSINPNNPYYNYYQYLPLRSTTAYSASQLSSKINAKTDNSSKMWNLGNSLVTNQNTYGVNALLMAGLAANESAWGKSSIAQSKNNLFGLNAVDSSPGTSANSYSSPDVCVRNFAEGWMSKRYFNPNNSNYYGSFFGNKASGLNVKYASDPYWGEKAANIAWNLDTAGSDRYRYTIGIKDVNGLSHTDLNVRKESSTSSTSIFTTGAQSSQAFLVLGEENGFYKIQSDPVLNSARTAINTSSGNYNFSGMYAYAGKDYITIVSGKVDSSGSGNDSGNNNSNNNTNGTGNNKADTLVVRRGSTYYFKYTLSNGVADLTFNYGRADDEVLIGDWDGDGIDTLCVRRGNLYYFKNSLSSGAADSVIRYGRVGDEVLAGDWNGDGKDTLCVRRENTYYIKNSISGGIADITIPYGRVGDKVLVGDWNGDGIDTLCVRRGNTYYFKNSLTSGVADSTIPYGWTTDKVLTGDWNGDGKDTLCIRRDNAYHIKNSISSGGADKIVLYGRVNDITYAGTWKK